MIEGLYPLFNHWHATPGQAVWVVSDLHFGDAELRAGTPGRPSDEDIIANINKCVGKKGILICLGDVGDIEMAKRLKGYKILVCGNHDVGATHYEEVFNEIYTGPLMIAERIILSHEPIPGITWAINLHGHQHDGIYQHDAWHFNFALEAIKYQPVNFNVWMKQGNLSKVQSLHRLTIDTATKKARKRGYKYGTLVR